MKTVTYHGPADRLKVGDIILPAGRPVQLSNERAARCADNPRVTVDDITPVQGDNLPDEEG